MGKHSRHLSTRDRYDFLIDCHKSVLQVMFDGSEYSERFKRLEVNSKGQYCRPLYESGEKISVRKFNGIYFLEVSVDFNFNRHLRYFYKDHFGLKRIQSVWAYGDNVIPSQIRQLLKDSGIEMPAVRQQGYKLFFKHLDRVRTDVVRFLKEVVGITWEKEWIVWILKVAEINFDILTLPEVQLAEDKNIQRRFNEVVDVIEKDCVFKNDGRTSTVPGFNDLTDTWLTSGDKQVRMIAGRYKYDESLQRLYLKESGHFAGINRIERRFEGRFTLCRHIDGNTIKNERDFIEKINALAAATFIKNYEILKGETHYSSKSKKRVLLTACRLYGGNKYWYDMYRVLKRKGVIHFNQDCCSTIRPLGRKAAELCRRGILFKRKSPGVYVVDWTWLLSAHRTEHITKGNRNSQEKSN